jgi:hypothetical protein
MNFDTLALIALVLAAIPCGLFLLNLLVYRPLVNQKTGTPEQVSILIPARNEEDNIRATLAAVVANCAADFEVIVLDDHSTDRTAAIVSEFAARDPRVRLECAPPLPVGWCGKQHACHVLAKLARHPLLVFIDADVRLAPDALARMGGFMERDTVLDCGSPLPLSDAPKTARGLAQSKTSRSSSPLVNRKSPFVNPPALASGVPRQELGTFSERLLLPLIHFVLLGYLPMPLMHWTKRAGFSAGCGQLFIARRDAYFAAGGHAAIRSTLHDGVKLPRAFRRAGFHTDLFDATDLATCRMYHTNAETWRGLGENATEGLGAPGTILPITALLVGGQVLPAVLLACAAALPSNAVGLAIIALALSYAPRLLAAAIFRQPWGSALLHPIGVLALLAIQWLALGRQLLGRPMQWKGRAYPSTQVRSGAMGAVRSLLAAASLVLPGAADVVAGESATAGSGATNLACRDFELRDQFDVIHRFTFPTTNVTVLAIADRQGNEQVDSWIAPIRRRFAGGISIAGIADVVGAPGWRHESIQKKFQKQRTHPVMLDWDATVTAALHSQKGVVNVFVLDRRGLVLTHATGPAVEASLHRVTLAIEHALAAPRINE